MARWTGTELAIELGSVRALDVRVVAGEVSIIAGPTPRVDATVEAGPDLEVTIEDGRLTIVHERSGVENLIVRRGPKVLLTVVVPGAAAVTARSVSAPVMVVGIEAPVNVTTVSGDVTATDVRREIAATTVSGDVIVMRAAPEDATIRTVSGGVTLDADAVPSTSVVTVSGDVNLRMPEDSALDLDITTMSGAIDCAFALDARHDTRRRLVGRIAGGGRPVTVRTVSGAIAVLAKHPAAA